MSMRLNGTKPPSLEFGDQVIEACAPRAKWPERKAEFRKLRNRPRTSTAAPVVLDARTRILEAQDETVRAQAHAIRALDELNHTRDQLAAGVRLEYQAAQIIAALRTVLMHLVGVGDSVVGERAQAKMYLQRAKDERARAEHLADQAQTVLDALGQRLAAGEVITAEPVITSDAVLLDVTAGLASVEQLLDEQDAQLSHWEDADLPEVAARLGAQYADASMPMAILASDGRILWTNRQFQFRFKCSAESAASMRWTDVVRGWIDEDDHLIRVGDGYLDSVQVRFRPEAGCTVAVLYEPRYPEFVGIPPIVWLDTRFGEVGGFSSDNVGALQVSFEVAPNLDDDWRFDQMFFDLVSKGRAVIARDEGCYLLVFDGSVLSLAELIEDVRPVFEGFGEFTLDAAVEPSAFSPERSAELLWQVDTSLRWARAVDSGRLWPVPVPVFRQAVPAPARQLQFLPLVEGSGGLVGLEVVNPISLETFDGVAEQLREWQESPVIGIIPRVEIMVTAEDLRRYDWRQRLMQWWDVKNYICLVLDELRDFESFALLRRFEFMGAVRVRSSVFSGEVLEKLYLDTSRSVADRCLPLDAREVENVLRRQHDSRLNAVFSRASGNFSKETRRSPGVD
ncbi:hypothetical protein [Amycolatopsis sp. GA6-003]|uniref:hypothetical protein n=1 Tax=Amycolatopsis sp. GA6-003 TaxID=2652444 RepID=UPI00391740AC